jgi:hypothetical protein
MSAITRTRIHLILLWAVWVAISAGGQLLGLLAVYAVFTLADSRWGIADPSTTLTTLLILTGPFVACGVGAIPQALLLRHRWAPVWGYVSTSAWAFVSAVSGLLLLCIGYLLFHNNGMPGWSDLFAWYLPVITYVALLVTLLQAALLWGVLAVPRLLFYVLLTTLGWIVGWSSLIASQFGTVLGPSSFLVGELPLAIPLIVIAAASGLVLAAPLASLPRQLPHEVARRRWLPFLLIRLTLVALVGAFFLVLLVTGMHA